MIRIVAAVSGVALSLAGCVTGLSSSSPTDTFTTQVSYQDAYHAATAQAERCLRGEGAYRVSGVLDAAGQGGLVRVIAPFTDSEVTRVEIEATGAHASRVTQTMWGRGLWNTDAIRAMREAIIYGVPSCVAYMPGDPQPTEEAWTLPRSR